MARKKEQKTIQGYCGECIHHTNEHCLDVKGVPFMCNCPHREGNLFMRHDWCEKFRRK